MNRFTCFCSVTFTAVGMLLATTAVAAEKAEVDPSGTWRWEHEEGGETVKDVLKLKFDGKKISGTYQGRSGPHEITDAKIKKNELTFDLSLEFEGHKISLKFAGKIKGDKVDGNVLIQTGEGELDFPWKAERSLKTTDVVGAWKLSIKLPDGNVVMPVLKLSLSDDKKELKGEYISDAADLDVSEIQIKNNKLFFTVSGGFRGGTLTTDYKVQFRGDKLAGEIEFDFNGQTGELEVKGKREAEKKKDAK